MPAILAVTEDSQLAAAAEGLFETVAETLRTDTSEIIAAKKKFFITF